MLIWQSVVLVATFATAAVLAVTGITPTGKLNEKPCTEMSILLSKTASPATLRVMRESVSVWPDMCVTNKAFPAPGAARVALAPAFVPAAVTDQCVRDAD